MKATIAQKVQNKRDPVLVEYDYEEPFSERFNRRIKFIKRNVESDLLRAHYVNYHVAVVKDVHVGAKITYVTKDQILNDPDAEKVWDKFQKWAEKNGLYANMAMHPTLGIPYIGIEIDDDDYNGFISNTITDQCFVEERGFFKLLFKLFQRH